MQQQKHPYVCTDVWERLDDYLDQELPPDEIYLILEHISGCPACAAASQRNYAALAQLREAIQALALPTGMAHRLSERLEACRQK